VEATIIPRPEYPRPQFERGDWLNLNGEWEFAFDDADEGLSAAWFEEARRLPARIVVPFPYQSPLSGIGETACHDVVWYARDFDLPDAYTGCQIWLRFGAVDYSTQVWVNGEAAGENRGGQVPFSMEVTAHLRPGRNRITLRAEDRADPCQPRGHQRGAPGAGCDGYTATTGIWQTVWLEPVAPTHIEHLRIVPNVERETVRLELTIDGAQRTGLKLCVCASLEGRAVADAVVRVEDARITLDLPLRQLALWSPEYPFLYDLELTLLVHGMAVDRVRSYFGMRETAVSGTELMLNGRPLHPRLVLDMGYFPDGLLAAPTDEALRRDVDLAKALGFDGVWKSQKAEDPRWLTWCDRLGLLVWSEPARAPRWGPEMAEAFVEEWARIVERDLNHPCIVAWAPFGECPEGAGSSTARAPRGFEDGVVALTRALDSSRPVVGGDTPERLPRITRTEHLADAMSKHESTEASPGFCFVQFADVEQDTRGLLDARREPKAQPSAPVAPHRARQRPMSAQPGSAAREVIAPPRPSRVVAAPPSSARPPIPLPPSGISVPPRLVQTR
jgi:beta-galactosidase/beta-glucuronidase